jgi:hypothetical protein
VSETERYKRREKSAEVPILRALPVNERRKKMLRGEKEEGGVSKT